MTVLRNDSAGGPRGSGSVHGQVVDIRHSPHLPSSSSCTVCTNSYWMGKWQNQVLVKSIVRE